MVRIPEEFDGKPENWEDWKNEFLVYLIASEKDSKEERVKVNILLNSIGKYGRKVFQSFSYDKGQKTTDFNLILQKYDEHFTPMKNIFFARFEMMSRRQKEDESVESFVTDLKFLAKSCEFQNLEESMVLTHLICGLRDSSLKASLLQEKNLTLAKAVEMCRMKQMIMKHNEVMAHQTQSKVDEVRRPSKSSSSHRCRFCNSFHAPRQCPAWGKRCWSCQGINHFVSTCRSSLLTSMEKNVGKMKKLMLKAKG